MENDNFTLEQKPKNSGINVHSWSNLPMIDQYSVFDEVQDAVKVG